MSDRLCMCAPCRDSRLPTIDFGAILAEIEAEQRPRRKPTCNHCGEKGATVPYEDSVLGTEYMFHEKCFKTGREVIEAGTAQYMYGEN